MTTTENKVTLYIATNNTTGLKYFGKTSRYFSENSLQLNYHGSGLYWKRHINKYGDDITMQIYGVFGIKEVEQIATTFSKKNNIVESNDWANLKDENGMDGSPKGIVFTDSHKENIGISSKKKFVNIETSNATNSLDALKYWEYKSEDELSIINNKKSQKGEKNGMFGTSRAGEDCPTFGKVWVTKNKENKMVDKSEVESYISLGWLKGVYQKNGICKHCGVEMLKFHITRYHNDNCKSIR